MGELTTEIRRLRLDALKGQDVNARYMTAAQFEALARNIAVDGALTSVPLVVEDGESYRIVSGHHRVSAGIRAGVVEADVMVVTSPMTRQQEVALQLSHNAIAGEDDPALLKRLYEELQDVDWRDYSGLDDKTLALLESVDIGSLSEAQLDFTTIQLLFLPNERAAAESALEQATKAVSTDGRWLCRGGDYEEVLDALSEAQHAHHVWNVAAAFGVILEVFSRHLDELVEGYLDTEGDPKDEKQWVPISSLFRSRTIPSGAASVIERALRAMENEGLVGENRWQALELWAADFLAGGHPV